jgi:fatty aldehyde-generating acyl-ACP reductase
MPTFAVIAHPSGYNHLMAYLRWLKPTIRDINPKLLLKLFEWTKPFLGSKLPEVKSITGIQREGIFIALPLTPDVIETNRFLALEKVKGCCQMADELGCKIAALGGFSSIVGTFFPEALTENIKHCQFTTGNTLTAAYAWAQLQFIFDISNYKLARAKAAILGGNGDIGRAITESLLDNVAEITITGRDVQSLCQYQKKLNSITATKIFVTIDNKQAVQDADIVVAATSNADRVLTNEDFKPGCIVCDVGFPKNIENVVHNRNDVLVFLGGLAKPRHNVGFEHSIDLPDMDLLFGCFAEAIILDFEQRYEPFSIGRGNITKAKMDFIYSRAVKHGYYHAPIFSQNRFLSESEIINIVKLNPRIFHGSKS